MSNLGYDPFRVDLLARRLDHAVAELAELATAGDADPAAGDAMHAVRLTQYGLELHWRPLLRRLTTGDLLRGWHGSGLDAATFLESAAADRERRWPVNRFDSAVGELVDDVLVALVARLDESLPLADDDTWADDPATLARRHHALARVLARRVLDDPDFARRVVEVIPRHPTLTLLLATAEMPSWFHAAALRELAVHAGWEAGHEMQQQSVAAEVHLRALLPDPAACLQLLADSGVRRWFAHWPALDQELVADVVVAGLYGAPTSDPRLLRAGSIALHRFVELANDEPFDQRGFRPGLSLGLAATLGGYVPTFVGSLRLQHGWVFARSRGPGAPYDLALGTYDDVTDFVGALLRHPGGRAQLGALLATLARDAVADRPHVELDHVAEFAELLRRAADNEDAELAVAAAARRATLTGTFTVVGFAVSAATTATGTGPLGRLVAGRGVSLLNDAARRRVSTATIDAADFEHVTFVMLQAAACRRLVDDADLRRRLGMDEPPAETLDELAAQLERVAELAEPAEAADELGVPSADAELVLANVEDRLRVLGGGAFLDEVLGRPTVHDLTDRPLSAD